MFSASGTNAAPGPIFTPVPGRGNPIPGVPIPGGPNPGTPVPGFPFPNPTNPAPGNPAPGNPGRGTPLPQGGMIYQWDFGDTVTLTVISDLGQRATTSKTVTVSDPD